MPPIILNTKTEYKIAVAQRFALPALGRGRRSRPAGKMVRRRKLPEIAAESPASGARFVGTLFALRSQLFKCITNIFANLLNIGNVFRKQFTRI